MKKEEREKKKEEEEEKKEEEVRLNIVTVLQKYPAGTVLLVGSSAEPR